MSRTTTLLSCILFVGTLVLGVCGADAEETATVAWETDADQAWHSAQEDERLLLLYFTMDNCVFCRKMERETFTDPNVTADIEKEFVAANLTAEENAALVQKLRVRSFPTTVIISPESGVIDYLPGFVSAEQLRTRLSTAMEGGPQPQNRRRLSRRSSTRR